MSSNGFHGFHGSQGFQSSHDSITSRIYNTNTSHPLIQNAQEYIFYKNDGCNGYGGRSSCNGNVSQILTSPNMPTNN